VPSVGMLLVNNLMIPYIRKFLLWLLFFEIRDLQKLDAQKLNYTVILIFCKNFNHA
jgi:hypothetical protein